MMNQRISYLTSVISGEPQLYTWKKGFIQDWWDSAYAKYISGNEFTECDRTSLFNIFKKYLPERAWLRESLFTEAMLDSDVGQPCLDDMAALCTSMESVVYYPGLLPMNNCSPICSKPMSDIEMQG
ncbi:hypothetical protein N7532_001122 [Penicillium argentinense]|uniref:Uncharacterized protein n=1 Tax=Penicillium argentinense TaxID=1131581 RepID=A0A9W9G3H0_9EURO|nr:uncharacterized protein N7532_001122 [Penicillium argentinense]KAJ5110587.1 hypothetical protein N7532_001122 [Penicillium argentinense]